MSITQQRNLSIAFDDKYLPKLKNEVVRQGGGEWEKPGGSEEEREVNITVGVGQAPSQLTAAESRA